MLKATKISQECACLPCILSCIPVFSFTVQKIFTNFFCSFLYPDFLFFFQIYIVLIVPMYYIWETSRKNIKKNILFQNLFWLRLLEKRFIQFSAFSLEFQKFVSNTRTIFSHSRPDYFWKQNTIPFFIWQWMPDHCVKWQTTNTTTICECANTCWLPSRWQQGYR